MHRQGQRNYEGRPDRYLNRDSRNNRDARINWRPEYRPNNYRNQERRRNRDMRYRPNYNENNRDDRTNRYPGDGYQDHNEDRRYTDRNSDRRYDNGRNSTGNNVNNDELNRENATGRLNFKDARRQSPAGPSK